MRNLEERMAEISRRSDEILKGRRQRKKRARMVCIPVALCAVLITVFSLPEIMSANSSAMDEPIDTEAFGNLSVNDSSNCITSTAVKSVTVSTESMTQTISEPSAVVQICNQLEVYHLELTEGDRANGSATGSVHVPATDEPEDNNTSAVGAPAVEYTITLTMHDGSAIEYCLAGNALRNQTAGETVALTKDQLLRLKGLLKIPLP